MSATTTSSWAGSRPLTGIAICKEVGGREGGRGGCLVLMMRTSSQGGRRRDGGRDGGREGEMERVTTTHAELCDATMLYTLCFTIHRRLLALPSSLPLSLPPWAIQAAREREGNVLHYSPSLPPSLPLSLPPWAIQAARERERNVDGGAQEREGEEIQAGKEEGREGGRERGRREGGRGCRWRGREGGRGHQ